MKVIVYSNPGCVFCQITREFLEANKIDYENRDVSSDEKSLNEMIEKSGQMGVPVIDIDGKIVVGFDKNLLLGILGL